MRELFGKRLPKLAAAGLVAAMTAGATVAPVSANSSGGTIAETVVAVSGADGFDSNANDFDILLQALTAADLVGAVADPQADLTVFAPNDRAFKRLAWDLGYRGFDNSEAAIWDFLVSELTRLGGGDPIPVLTSVLTYHVSPGSQSLNDVRRAGSFDTLLGAPVAVRGSELVDADPDSPNARIRTRQANIRTSNGIIHSINRVLLPVDVSADTIAGFVVRQSSTDGFDSNFQDYDMLLAALSAADLVGAVSDPAADLTVFAPKDVAFIRLARDLGYKGYDEAGSFDFIVAALTELGDGDPIPVLKSVLLYHVSAGSQSLHQIQRSGSVDTLLGASFGVHGDRLEDADPDLRNPRINKFRSDVPAGNGTVHTINRVLIPLDI